MSVKNSCSTQLDSFYINKTAGLKHIHTHECTVYSFTYLRNIDCGYVKIIYVNIETEMNMKAIFVVMNTS